MGSWSASGGRERKTQRERESEKDIVHVCVCEQDIDPNRRIER